MGQRSRSNASRHRSGTSAGNVGGFVEEADLEAAAITDLDTAEVAETQVVLVGEIVMNAADSFCAPSSLPRSRSKVPKGK